MIKPIRLEADNFYYPIIKLSQSAPNATSLVQAKNILSLSIPFSSLFVCLNFPLSASILKAETHRTRNRNATRAFGGFVCTGINKLSCHCYFIKLLKGRIYSLPKLQKSRRVSVSRPVCLDLYSKE